MSLISNLLYDVPAPGAAIEIAASHVLGVVVEPRGAGVAVTAHARAALAPGALTPGLTGTNVHDKAAVTAAIDRVLEDIVVRCRELKLRLATSEDEAVQEFTVLLTVQVMNYLHSGRHRIAL